VDLLTLVLIVIAVLAIAGVAAWYFLDRRRRTALREQFGPEYERTVRATGDRKHAERELEHRAERVRKLDIRPLAPEQRARFAEEWRLVQARFVDAPTDAISDADLLVTEAMRAKGYPTGDFEQRAADVSVDHPRVVEHYRAARAIATDSKRGAASTEQLRQAMVHYRALFEDLLEPRSNQEMEVKIERAS
jgi:hypothetical protein